MTKIYNLYQRLPTPKSNPSWLELSVAYTTSQMMHQATLSEHFSFRSPPHSKLVDIPTTPTTSPHNPDFAHLVRAQVDNGAQTTTTNNCHLIHDFKELTSPRHLLDAGENEHPSRGKGHLKICTLNKHMYGTSILLEIRHVDFCKSKNYDRIISSTTSGHGFKVSSSNLFK